MLKNVSFPKHVSYTDFLLYLVALSRAKKVSYYDKALAFYLQDRPGNTATDIRKSIINDYLRDCKIVCVRMNDSLNLFL
ncbi:hypothetical protein LBKG_00148 [Lactobacillus crispatus CTV-05]|nr:hypothetical protein LBKG_00148 [Lactobacillus crispatus CTV-05]